MRFWNGFKWREISDLEAKYREQAGQLKDQPPDPGAPKRVVRGSRPSEEPVAPSAVTPQMMPDQDGPSPSPPSSPPSPSAAIESTTPATDHAASELSQAELERLTAPATPSGTSGK